MFLSIEFVFFVTSFGHFFLQTRARNLRSGAISKLWSKNSKNYCPAVKIRGFLLPQFLLDIINILADCSKLEIMVRCVLKTLWRVHHHYRSVFVPIYLLLV